MIRNAWLALLVLSAFVSVCGQVNADGFLLKKGGYVPEREQMAFIEWKDGQERLWVATRTDAEPGPTVWIVPVPAKPEQVRVEPVEVFPLVTGANQVGVLRKRLADIQDDVLWRNTFLMPAFFLGQRTSSTFGGVAGRTADGVEVHAHVERHGMVVQVLTARTTTALDAYLRELKLDVKAEQLHSLTTYLGQEHSLICAWKAQAKSTARALRIDFPSPHVFYPMLPTRVYNHVVRTSIFVRGWVQPVPTAKPSGVHCERGLWSVKGTALEDSTVSILNRNYLEEKADLEKLAEPLTRVIVSSRPSEWVADLVLEPYTGASPGMVSFLARHRDWLSLVLNCTLGVLLGLCLPWLWIPADQRRWHDWLVLAVLGGNIYFSSFVMAVGLLVWCCLRFPHARWTRKDSADQIILVTGGLVLLLLLGTTVTVDYHRMDAVQMLAMLIVLVVAVIVFIVPMVLAVGCVWRAFHGRAGWLLIFLAMHGALVAVTCQALLAWLP